MYGSMVISFWPRQIIFHLICDHFNEKCAFHLVVSAFTADKLYESTGKHIYPISAIMIVNETVILIGVCVLYKLLAPRQSQRGARTNAGVELELNSLDGDLNSAEKGDMTNLCEVSRSPTQVNDDNRAESIPVQLDGGGLDLSPESAPLLNEGIRKSTTYLQTHVHTNTHTNTHTNWCWCES